MSAKFEALIWNDLDIPLGPGKTRLVRGLYEVTILKDERGRKAGAKLKALDVPGEPVTRLTQAQFEILDGTRFFDRR